MRNKIAIVTGSSQGIGKAIAYALLKEGYSVVLTSRREAELKETAAEFADFKTTMLIQTSDVADPNSVSNLFKKTVEVFGRLDLLVNNAGISAPGKPIEEIPYLEWKSILDVNLTGAFLCTQEAFRIMKQQTPLGGRIINIGSVSAFSPRAFFTSYTVSKHGLNGLTKASALEGREYNIACGQVDIGNVKTDSKAKLADLIPQSEQMMSMESISKMIVQIADLPLDENVLYTRLHPLKMPFLGRG